MPLAPPLTGRLPEVNMNAALLTILIGLTLRVIVPVALVLLLGSLIQAYEARHADA